MTRSGVWCALLGMVLAACEETRPPSAPAAPPQAAPRAVSATVTSDAGVTARSPADDGGTATPSCSSMPAVASKQWPDGGHPVWKAPEPGAWTDAIEHYAPKRAPGRPLGEAACAWAVFLNVVHIQVHPLYADGYLGSVENLREDDPRRPPRKTYVELEIAVDAHGSVARLGVVKSSTHRGLDAAALESVRLASPLPDPPRAIFSADGLAWFRWEFHADEVFACSTMNIRPQLYAE